MNLKMTGMGTLRGQWGHFQIRRCKLPGKVPRKDLMRDYPAMEGEV